MSTLYERITELCKQRGVSGSKMCLDLGMSKSTMSGLKSGRAKGVSAATAQKFASYLGVSVDYLLGKEDTEYNTFISYQSEKNKKRVSKEIEKNIEDARNALIQVAENIKASSAETFTPYRVNNTKTVSDITSNAVMIDKKEIYMIPVFESVSAGFGSLAQNNVEDYTPLFFSSQAEAEETICVKVKGDSMFPKIEEGDIIQVHKQTSVDSGTIAVVLVDGDEGLVKKVVYGDDWIELHSINPMYPVMRFEKADVLRLSILGQVKKIIKNV